jgi:RNA polymerase sigma factor (TIGR02999 family)
MNENAEQTRQVTALLAKWGGGDKEALNELTPLIYNELRNLARAYLRRERFDHTLEGTALVHEAYMRLVDQRGMEWRSRNHFFAIAAELIRRILVDHARARMAAKRGGNDVKLSLDEDLVSADRPDAAVGIAGGKDIDLIGLDDALNALAEADKQQSRIVELRFFGGLTIEETANVLDISPATVKRDWVMAKAFLKREMTRQANL